MYNIKVWWNDETSVDKEKYQNLSEEELTMLLSDGQMEVVKQKQTQIGEVPMPVDPMAVHEDNQKWRSSVQQALEKLNANKKV